MFTYMNSTPQSGKSSNQSAKVPFTVADQQQALKLMGLMAEAKQEVVEDYVDTQRELSLEQPSSTSTEDLVKAHKLSMLAVPAMASASNRRGRKSRRKTAPKGIISKSYNNLASRPINRVVNRASQISENLRFDVIGILSTSTTVPTFAAYAFQISSASNYSQYLGLFDQYRIDEIEVWLDPQQSQSVLQVNQGLLASTVDLDDANTPSAFATVEDHQSSLVTNGLNSHYHRWVPHTAVATYSGAFTSFSNMQNNWIDSASPNVQHFGLKIAATSTSSVIIYNMSVRLRCSFKEPGI
jgi:hypothetical protein